MHYFFLFRCYSITFFSVNFFELRFIPLICLSSFLAQGHFLYVLFSLIPLIIYLLLYSITFPFLFSLPFFHFLFTFQSLHLSPLYFFYSTFLFLHLFSSHFLLSYPYLSLLLIPVSSITCSPFLSLVPFFAFKIFLSFLSLSYFPFRSVFLCLFFIPLFPSHFLFSPPASSPLMRTFFSLCRCRNEDYLRETAGPSAYSERDSARGPSCANSYNGNSTFRRMSTPQKRNRNPFMVGKITLQIRAHTQNKTENNMFLNRHRNTMKIIFSGM